jgi:superfamily II DNA or RNA helicase
MKLILRKNASLAGFSPCSAREAIKDKLTIPNPARIEAARQGRYCLHLPDHLRFYRETPDTLTFPRGFAREAWGILQIHGHKPEIEDRRLTLEKVTFIFSGVLRDYQEQALEATGPHSDCVIQAATGSGKTVFCLADIARKGQPALILVHTQALLAQWVERIRQFLGIEAGTIGNGKNVIRPVTVATVQSAKNRLPDLVDRFGMVFVDEAHRTPCSTFSKVVSAFPARFRLGVTATPERRDAMTPALHFICGPLAHKVDPGNLVDQGAILRPTIEVHYSRFRYEYQDDFAAMVQALIEDEPRNRMILDVIRQANKPVLCVSDRVEHVERLAAMHMAGNTAVMHGATTAKERQAITAALEQGGVDVLFATSSLIGEGYDAKGLCSLVLASPVKWSGKLIQLCGRILRPAPGKTATVHDITDPLQPVLKHQAKARMDVYRREFRWVADRAKGGFVGG